MKGWVLGLALAAASAWAGADELALAQKQWEEKNFTAAFQGFSKLAAAGNAAAQLQLGEMYGFGEDTAENLAQAEAWLGKAAAGGHPEAAQSLGLVRERAARKADIAAYTSHFQGQQLALSAYGCQRPQVPAVSTSNKDIQAVNTDVKGWNACYGRFVAGLNAALPATNTIPADIVKLMNNEEFNRASALILGICRRHAEQGEGVANEVVQQTLAWKEKTEKYAMENNEKTELKLDILKRQMGTQDWVRPADLEIIRVPKK